MLVTLLLCEPFLCLSDLIFRRRSSAVPRSFDLATPPHWLAVTFSSMWAPLTCLRLIATTITRYDQSISNGGVSICRVASLARECRLEESELLGLSLLSLLGRFRRDILPEAHNEAELCRPYLQTLWSRGMEWIRWTNWIE